MRKRRKYNAGFAFVVFTVVVLFIITSYKGINLKAKDAALQEEKARCEQKLEEELQREEQIEAYREYINSNDFIESMARDKLGLIYPGDIIFEANEE